MEGKGGRLGRDDLRSSLKTFYSHVRPRAEQPLHDSKERVLAFEAAMIRFHRGRVGFMNKRPGGGGTKQEDGELGPYWNYMLTA